MANYSEFNNNNYLPSLQTDMAATNFTMYPGMNHSRGPTVLQNSFTFTAPTQCSTMGTPRPCIQTTSPINLSAPGVGASWQHSIPTTMPWVDLSGSSQYGPLGSATVFTGMPYNTVSSPHSSDGRFPRRPKRKSTDVPQELPPSKVHLCADQLANMRISPRQHEDAEQRREAGDRTPGRSHEWERFRELENRLAGDSDEELEPASPERDISTGGDGVRVSVAGGVLDTAKTSPILPRTVMEGINKPCMQVVLWTSPEKLIRDISSEDGKAGSSSTASTASTCPSTSKPSDKTCSSGARLPLTSTDNIMGSPAMDTLLAPSLPSSLAPSLQSSLAQAWSSLSSPYSISGCSSSPSPAFLKPLSSSNAQTLVSSALSSGAAPGIRFNIPHSSGSFNNNITGSNNNFTSSNNNNNNYNSDVMDIFDSVDDDMQL